MTTIAIDPGTEQSVTHAILVAAAAKWLQKQRCSVVVTEIATANFEQPDAIGWHGPRSILVECKASRSDFMADRLKPFRVNPELGVGRLRYFLTPPGLIQHSELPPRWGLLELGARGVWQALEAGAFPAINQTGEISLLLSCVRRIGRVVPVGVSVKCYAMDTQGRTTLGIEGEP
jgi:hypothetical protein